MEMDIWKFFGITHTDHTVMNPMSLAKTEEIIECLCLPDGGRVLDVACGKAEFLCRLGHVTFPDATIPAGDSVIRNGVYFDRAGLRASIHP